jgi:hypothetical protein
MIFLSGGTNVLAVLEVSIYLQARELATIEKSGSV